MILVNDLRPGMSFEENNDLFRVLDISRNKTARSQMNIKVKVKNLRTGTMTEIGYTAGDKVEQAILDKKTMQYLYDSGDGLVFMDTDSYEQIEIQKARLEWELNFLKENDSVTITFYGVEIIGIELPDKVALKVVQADPAVKGDTATNALKNATLETGLEIRVPLFITEGEMVLVSTEDGKYSSRA
ncbi:MAG TPA: elongation factor P [Erysipelothrix sp.]|jgi:elongation factor P|nr:elongation factor P [Erysipelothrix sp.]